MSMSLERILEVSDKVCADIESILNGTYRPLKGFMDRKQHRSVIKKGKLITGEYWSVPIVLPVDPKKLEKIKHEKSIILVNNLNYRLARLFIQDVYTVSKVWYIGGKLERINKAFNFNFKQYRRSTKDMICEIDNPSGEKRVIGYSIDRILYRPDIDFITGLLDNNTFVMIQQHDTNSDIDSFLTTIRCNLDILAELDSDNIIYNISSATLPDDSNDRVIMEGIIHRNYLCTHMITDLDVDRSIQKKIGLTIIEKEESELYPDPNEIRQAFRSRQYLHPFMFDSTIELLKDQIKPFDLSGICIHLIGLVNSGKTTIANALKDVIFEHTNRIVTVLDSRSVAEHINHDLHIDDQTTKIKRITYIVSNIVNNDGVVIYNSVNVPEDNLEYFRESIEKLGALYLEVFVDTPLRVCEKRDTTGLYELARTDKIDYLAGVNVPHCRPKNPDIVLSDPDISVSLETILDRIKELKYII